MENVMVINEKDNVGISLSNRAAGEKIAAKVGGSMAEITLADDIPYAHKFALKDINRGEKIVKYGEIIGLASQAIKVGQWVHVHNVESIRARGDKK